MKASKLTVLLIMAPMMGTLISSCATGTAKVDSQKAIKQAVDAPKTWAQKAKKYGDKSIDWLKAFNDPLMLKLIAEGKASNLDLRAAAGNMDKAWLLAEKAGAALKPTVDLSLKREQAGSGVSGSSSKGQVKVGLQVSWEADVWGRMESGVGAAHARAQSAEADYIFAQHSLSANIAKSYFKVIEAKLQADITRKNLNILKKTMRITKVKHDNGMSSAQDVALHRADLASAKEQLITIEGSQRNAIRALEVLLGRYPSAELDIGKKLPTLPGSPPSGVPSEILERRPDIISAERQIAAAYQATDVAKAARLPSFSLTSTIGGTSGGLSNVLDSSNILWQLAGNIVAPLFDGGKRKLDVKIATVEQKQAVANYAQQALTAFSEVENNLDQSKVLAGREVALIEVFKQSKKAYRIAQLRYKSGESDLLDTLQIQQKAISAESNLLSIKRSQLEQRVNLYLALGGNW